MKRKEGGVESVGDAECTGGVSCTESQLLKAYCRKDAYRVPRVMSEHYIVYRSKVYSVLTVNREQCIV